MNPTLVRCRPPSRGQPAYRFFCFDIPQIAARAFPAPLAALATAACRCLVGGTLSGAECAAVKSLVVEDKPREQGKSQSEKTARKLRRPTLDGQLGCMARTRFRESYELLSATTLATVMSSVDTLALQVRSGLLIP